MFSSASEVQNTMDAPRPILVFLPPPLLCYQHRCSLFLIFMFVLKQPGGKGKGRTPSQFQVAFNFFGRLGIYFGAVRLAYFFVSGRALKWQATSTRN